MRPILVIATFNSGSTLLQRSLAFWAHQLIDSTVTNPHELLNGINYHNGRLIKQWTDVNAQSTQELQEILAQCPHPIVARLAYDHWLLRNDRDRMDAFFEFLKQKFDIVYVIREDLFDYALCYAVRRCTSRPRDKQINCVHTPQQRHELYEQLGSIEVSVDHILNQSIKYIDYLNWVNINFPDAKKITYDDLEIDVDQVCTDILPSSSSIAKKHGISIREYLLTQYHRSKNFNYNNPNLVQVLTMEKIIDRLCQENVLLDPIPIKSATWADKLEKITNLEHCIKEFNKWARIYCPAQQVTTDNLQFRADKAAQLYL